MPQRYQRQVPTDAEGNVVPVVRPIRPRVYDPEKERMKRALRPPLPYNPEKERLKRLLRGQHAPPVDSYPAVDAARQEVQTPQPEARADVGQTALARDDAEVAPVTGSRATPHVA